MGRIIIWILVVVVLISVFAYVLFFDSESLNMGWFGSYYVYADAELYEIGNFTSADEIKNLDISWIAGDIDIIVYDGNEIVVTEECDKELDENKQLRWRIDNGTLLIKFYKSKSVGFSIFKKNKLEKALTIKIPEAYADSLNNLNADLVSANINIPAMKYDTIKLNSVSGNITMNNVNAKNNVYVNAVSGLIDIKDCAGKKLDINAVSSRVNCSALIFSDEIDVSTVSGQIKIAGNTSNIECKSVSADISISGDFKDISCETTSGSFDIDILGDCNNIEIDTISGKCSILSIGFKDGFTLEFDTTSGDFSSDFETTSTSKKRFVNGNGACKIEFDSVSGDISINHR